MVGLHAAERAGLRGYVRVRVPLRGGGRRRDLRRRAIGSCARAGRPGCRMASKTVAVFDGELRLGPAVFSRLTGTPVSLGALPVDPFGGVLWWPPTDNDLGREWGNANERPLATPWKDAGLHRLLGISAEAEFDGGERLIVRTRLGAADKQFRVLVDYTWTSDGESLALRTQVRFDGPGSTRASPWSGPALDWKLCWVPRPRAVPPSWSRTG